MSPRLRRLVTSSAVALVFVGGAAAAATGSNSLSPLLGADGHPGPHVTIVPTTTTGTTTTTTTRDDPTTTLAHSTALASVESDPICATAANHGEAVSSVAKDDSTVGAEHGAAVSAMAKSDCGKSDDESPAPDITLPAICATAANHGEAVSSIAK